MTTVNRQPNIQNEDNLNESQLKPLRFQQMRVKDIYFKDKLCDEFRNSRYPMPENLRRGRNVAIVLSFIEFLCCVASLAFYFRRRAKIILILIICNFIFTGIGFVAKQNLSYCGLLTHATYTISVIGAFYIYIFIDYALVGAQNNDINKAQQGEETGSIHSLNTTVILLITSLPMLSLFIMGWYSCWLAIMIEREMDQRAIKENGGIDPEVQKRRAEQSVAKREADRALVQAQSKVQPNVVMEILELGQQASLADQEHVVELLNIEGVVESECAICLDAPRNTVMYPCGHQILCKPCGDRFQKEARHQVCPICRNRVQDIIQVFNS